jgi:lipopolysaccharide transport system ATP-binding protein
MSNTIIKVENLSKQYRLGEVSTGTISHDVNRWWQKVRGKEDPYLKIGEANDRTTLGNSDYVWALKDINFEVKQGEVLGIIGRNGAGKSTLLKLLSRTTAPTTGSIKIKGRVASLLEVGTGFHPELSGRDNIFLNGAILGMTRREIQSKFDEIVDFAGVERYIDTPVKRYSSGMYVRLAFAVAAHLEPEILIVDEVLAVGDAEFQKKALGKMKNISSEHGRTVLFVSHNLEAIYNLTSRVIIVNKGRVEFSGDTNLGIDRYNDYNYNFNYEYLCDSSLYNDNESLFISSIILENNFRKNKFSSAEPLSFKIIIVNRGFKTDKYRIGFRISSGESAVGLLFTDEEILVEKNSEKTILFTLKNHNLAKGYYSFDFSVGKGNEESVPVDFNVISKAISIEIDKKTPDSNKVISVWNKINWGMNQYTNYEIKYNQIVP